MLRRASRSHSTGMFSQRLMDAASAGLAPAITRMRSKKGCGKMCGKMSSFRLFFMAFMIDEQGDTPLVRPYLRKRYPDVNRSKGRTLDDLMTARKSLSSIPDGAPGPSPVPCPSYFVTLCYPNGPRALLI